MDEDNTLYFNGSYLIANDIDIDEYNDDNTTKSDLVISSISSPSLKNSKVNFSPVNNTIRYTPPMNFNGTDTFAYTIKDSEGRYDTGLVTVKIMVVNDKPNASNDLVYATEEVPININVTSNDSDFDKDDLLMVINNTSPLHGRLILNSINNMITYIPNSDYSGTDHFNYTISDTSGATDTGNVHVFLSAINDAPITFNQTVFTSHPNRAINIVMTGNDRDNDSLKFSIVDKPQLGEIRTIIPYNRTSSVIIYVPYDGLVEGIDTFTFNVSDGNSFDTGNVRVIIKSPLSKISSFDNPYIALDPGHYISGAIASIQDNNSADPKWIVSGNWKLILNNDTTTGIFDEKYKNHTDAQFSVAMNNTTTGYNQLSTKMFEAVMNMVITNGSALHKHQMYNFTLTNISIPNNTTMIFNGTTTLTMSDGPVHDIPISLTIKEGNVISILIDPARIGNHFGDTPIYGTVVKAFIVKK